MKEITNTTEAASTGEPGIAVVRGFNGALARGDVAGMVDFLDPQVEWRAPESVPWGGTFRGHEGFREFLGKVLAQPAEFRREILEYLDAGERVVVLLRQMGRPNGGDTEYDVPEVHVWTVRDGKILDFEGLFDTATVLRTLQLQPRG
jgi:ketosteroid isomerase-like protein